MRIACDARALVGPRTGVGTWTAAIMGGLARLPGWRVELLAHVPFELPPSFEGSAAAAVPPPRPPLPGTLWLQWLLPAQLERLRPDVFVAALAVAPRRCPVPSVVMVHDLTPRLRPERHTLKNRFCFNAYLEDSLDGAAAVVVPSEATRHDVLAVRPRLAGRIHVIGEGADPRFRPADDPEEARRIRDRYAGGRRYVLHLGTLEPRKGIPVLVGAWERLAAADPGAPDLVLAGAPGWGTGPILARIGRSPFRERIHLPGYVPDGDLPGLLRSAEAFVLASEAEGYGLPLAEALCCGVPSVVSDVPALREVAGGAALLVPPGDPAALAAALREALEPETSARLAAAAVARGRALRWDGAVAAWRRLLETVAGAA